MRISTTKSKNETKMKRIEGMGSNGKIRRKQSDKKRKILFFL